MVIECLPVGPLATNSYILGCEKTGRACIVDAADEAPVLIAALERLGLELQAVLQTHCHPDHIAAWPELIAATGAPVYMHPEEARMLDEHRAEMAAFFGSLPWPIPYQPLGEGDVVRVGELGVTVLYTPGHTRGSVCLSVGDALFTGDTLFAGGVGRYDLPGGDWDTLAASLRRLLTLPDTTLVHPGHGGESDIGTERAHNEWLQGLT